MVRPVQPCGFEWSSDAHSPEVARIRVSNWSSWFISNGGDIGNAVSTDIWTSKQGCSKMRRICLGRQRVIWWLYPRRSRLGLIEAPWCPTMLPDAGGIRGVRASASLKLLNLPPRPGVQVKYPRRSRLGLIEACSTPRPRRRRIGIRGVRASASLKRRGSGDRAMRVRGIRGVRASASLKF